MKVRSFLGDFQAMPVREAKAILQTILKSTHVWRDGRIEVAEGTTNRGMTGHLGYDQHHIETFEYREGEFTKTAERYIPHLLWSREWQRYYFPETG